MKPPRRNRAEARIWRNEQKCIAFFITVCIISILLIFFVSTYQYILTKFEHIPNISAIAARMQKRSQHLKETCKLLRLDIEGNDSLHKANTKEYLINHKHHLVWCNIFKSASTSWMYNFNILAGYSPKFLKKTKIVPLTLARQKYPRPSLSMLKKAFNNSVSFLIARHPFERLLSGYIDKIRFVLPHTYHRKLGKEIIMKYRKKSDNKPKWPTFPEFVSYLLDCVKNEQPLDMHWTPITEFCTPCFFSFDIIAHIETLHEDQQYLIKKADLKGLIKPQWRNVGQGTHASQIQKYYSELTKSQIIQLNYIYRYDFELFNYSLKGYLELGKPDDDPAVLLAAITLKDFMHIKNNVLPFVY